MVLQNSNFSVSDRLRHGFFFYFSYFKIILCSLLLPVIFRYHDRYHDQFTWRKNTYLTAFKGVKRRQKWARVFEWILSRPPTSSTRNGSFFRHFRKKKIIQKCCLGNSASNQNHQIFCNGPVFSVGYAYFEQKWPYLEMNEPNPRHIKYDDERNSNI